MSRIKLLIAVVTVAIFSTSCFGQGNVFDMSVGECFQDPSSLEFTDVEKVNCSEPHDNEVFALYDLTTDYLPSQDVMQAGCEDRFEAAMGINYYSSIYYVAMFGPTSESWHEVDDREVVCFIYLPGEQMVGVNRGTAR